MNLSNLSKNALKSPVQLILWGFPFLGGGDFFRFTLKAFISIRMTPGIIQNDYFDHVRHVWDIFGTIRSLKTIFWDYIFENFRLKMNKNTFFGLLWLYKGNCERFFFRTFVLSIVNIWFSSFSPYLRFFPSRWYFEFP